MCGVGFVGKSPFRQRSLFAYEQKQPDRRRAVQSFMSGGGPRYPEENNLLNQVSEQAFEEELFFDRKFF